MSTFDLDPFTDHPTRVRVVSFDPGPHTPPNTFYWSIDGTDDTGKYTDIEWSYSTFDAAIAAIPEFVQYMAERGVKWDWHTVAERKANQS